MTISREDTKKVAGWGGNALARCPNQYKAVISLESQKESIWEVLKEYEKASGVEDQEPRLRG
jgi:hypothetical protein